MFSMLHPVLRLQSRKRKLEKCRNENIEVENMEDEENIKAEWICE